MFFSGTTFFPYKLVALDGIPPPQQYLGRQREIPTERVLGHHPGDPRRPVVAPVEVATQTTEATETAEEVAVEEEAAEVAVEEEAVEEASSEEEEAPPTPTMDHSDGESAVEGYSLDGADSWAPDDYPEAGGDYYPTPVELTSEFMRLDDKLGEKYDAAVARLEKMEEEKAEAVAKLNNLEEERNQLAAALQEALTLHNEEVEKLEERRLSLL